MRFTFSQLASFASKWKKLRLTDEDLSALEQQIMEHPEAGDLMPGTGGVRKMRFAPPSWNTGKSGATRICYAVFVRAAEVKLFTLFAKNEKPNLSASDKSVLKSLMREFNG